MSTKNPTITALTDNAGLKTGTISQGEYTDDTTLVLSGTAKAGSKLKIFDGTESLGTVTADKTGHWKWTAPKLEDGQHSFQVGVIGKAGNVGALSEPYAVIIDTQLPAAPQIVSVVDNVGKTKGVVANLGKTDDLQPEIKGKADAGAIVTVYDYDTVLGTATADKKGHWSLTTAKLDKGSVHVFSARAQDAAGNLSAASNDYTVTLTGKDTKAPLAPLILTVSDDAEPSSGDLKNSGKTNDATPTLTGSAEALSQVEIFDGGKSLGKAKADATGDWQFTTPKLTDGVHRFTATVTDAAKNTSPASAAWGIQLDATAPTAPLITRITTNEVDRPIERIAPKGYTNDTSLLLSGRAEALSQLELFNGTTRLGSVQADKTGAWSYQALALKNGTTYAFNARASDAMGNTSPASADYSITIDTTHPGLTLSSDKTRLKAGETAIISFSFNEPPTGFNAKDITVTGGRLTNLKAEIDGKSYTARYIPTADTNVLTGSLGIAASSYTDAAGNDGKASNSLLFKGDTQIPNLMISSDKTTLKTGDVATVSFAFTEVPKGFVAKDITTISGVLSNLKASATDAKVYTALYTPTANVNSFTDSLTIAASSYTDAAGNPGKASNTLIIKADTQAPSLTISSDKTSLKMGETATLTFTFSEAPTGFEAKDITATGGKFSSLKVDAANSKLYTGVFTPTANTNDLKANLSVAASSYTDAVGNPGKASNTLTLKADTLAPGLTISSDKPTLKAGETAAVSFTFSETPTGFDAKDITATGGSFSHLNASATDSKLYTATWTPTAANGSLSVAEGSYTDAAGNKGSASNNLSLTANLQSPTVTLSSDKTTFKSGDTATVTFRFSEAPTGFDATDITTTGGTLSGLKVSATDSKVYTALLTPAPASNNLNGTISVAANSYANAGGTRNAASNTLSFSGDTQAPGLTVTSSTSRFKAGDTPTVTFTFNETPTGFDATDITTTGGSLSNFKVGSDAKVYTAQFTPEANTNALTGSISVAANSYADMAGNKGGSASLALSGDTKAPGLTSYSSSSYSLSAGQTASIGIYFDEEPTGLDLSDISVSSGSLSDLSGSGITRTVTWTPPANASGRMDIGVSAGSYTDAAGNPGTQGFSNSFISYNTVVSSGGGGSSVTPTPTTPTVTSTTGRIIDGYISNATVFADANKDGVWQSGEVKTTTNSIGSFTLTGGSGPLVASGGTDISTNLPFVGVLKAPEGSTVVTPLTTLVTAIQAANPTLSLTQAQSKVATSLGLNSGVNFTSFDPIATSASTDTTTATTALAVQKASIMVSNVIAQTVKAVQGANSVIDLTTVANQAMQTLATQVNLVTTTINLADANTLQTVLTTTGTALVNNNLLTTADQTQLSTVATTVAAVMAATNTAVNTVTLTGDATTALTNLTKAQVVSQGSAATAIASAVNTGDSSAASNYSNTTTLTTAINNAATGIINTNNVGLNETISSTSTSPINATSQIDIFTVRSGEYTVTINGFGSGDKLNFYNGAILNVVPDATDTDGRQSLTATDPVSGATTTVTLTGLTAVQDAGVFNVPSFATVFGNGTISTGSASLAVSTNGSVSASNLAEVFNLAVGTYSYTIDGFDAGDQLAFFPGAILNVVADSNQSDGIQELTATDPVSGATTTVILTGLSSSQDAGIFNLSSFNSVFGQGAIA